MKNPISRGLLKGLTLLLGWFSFTSTLMAQQKNYSEQWDKVNSFQSQGLPESALKVVDEIFVRATKENNPEQLVKAVIHQLKFKSWKEEDALAKNLDSLEIHQKNASFPANAIISSMIADIYWNYYQQNRWRFSNRTATVDYQPTDIRTWDLRRLVERVRDKHIEALKEKEKLKTIKVDVFTELVSKGYRTQNLRPTLYDFIAHRAIDFFSNDEPAITRPAEQFYLNDDSYLLPASEFAKVNITTPDSLAFKFYAITIMQEMIRFHLDDNNPAALIDVDLKRLQTVFNISNNPKKDELYVKALTYLEKTYASQDASAEASYYIAAWHYGQGQKYKPFQSSPFQWENKVALELCEKIITSRPNTPGGANCSSLKYQILEKSISLVSEEVQYPDKPFRVLAEYRNVPNLYYRVYPTDALELEQIEKEVDAYYKKKNQYKSYDQVLVEHFVKKSFAKSGQYKMPLEGDYQIHSAEIGIDGVPIGDYVILVSDNPKFTFEGGAVAYDITQVTNISFLRKTDLNQNHEFFFLHRETGVPLAGAKAQVWFEVYDYKTYRYKKVNGGILTADDNGYAKLNSTKDESKSYTVDVTWGTDHYYTGKKSTRQKNFYMSYFQEPYQYNSYQTTFFTDRSIYRPGQTIYFKGLMIQTDHYKNHSILPKQPSTVIFYDVNHKEIARVDVVTNEFGTFQGSFTAPNGVLTGQMQISDGYGSTYISVEEYKRPKFEVKVLPTKGSFRLDDIVKAKGEAKAFSGAPIDNAQVKYRIVREARFPWWWYWRCGSFPSSPSVEVANGYVKTNEKGEFEIPFKAVADASVPKESRPTYTYKVIADVTDLNGETRSGTNTVTVGYVALDMSIDIDDEVMLDDNDQEFTLSTKNLNGEFEAATGTITLYQLKTPSRVYRERKWSRADKHVIAKEEYTKLFPTDVYEDEDNSATWEKTKVTEKKFNTGEKKEVTIKELFSSKPGRYIVELRAKDAFGVEVVEFKEFTLYDAKSTTLPVPNQNWFYALKGEGEPGETAKIVLGTSYENTRVIYDVLQDGKVLKREFVTLNNSQKIFEIPLIEEYRGNIGVQFAYIRNNRVYTNCYTITVPYSNKQLDITFETFRNKLLPGEKEQWKMKITGPKGDKALSEMVATLYDASLDAFKPHNFSFNPYRYYSQGDLWDSNNSGFGTSGFTLFSQNWNEVGVSYHKTYDQLNWFGYYMSFYNRYRDYDDEVYGEVSYSMSRSADRKSSPKKKSMSSPSSPKMAKSESPEAEEQSKEIALDDVIEEDGVRDQKPGEKSAGKNGKKDDDGEVQIRKNMQETAFFFPQLQTDEKGSVIINFTIPEALTRWKMMGFAHTKDLKLGTIKNELVTQKDLMVVPNAPRFFRENDVITFQTKVTNLTDKKMSGTVTLKLFDAISMKPLDDLFKGTKGNAEVSSSSAIPDNSFNAEAGQSTMVEWTLKIPEGVGAITYRIIARADKFSDGEEMAIPVLTNRMLVTESMPLPVRSKQNKTFVMEKLVKNKSNTLRHHKLTLEFTSQPAWYAIQALPYLMEYPYECAEQTFSRLYANSIASHIVNSDPKIKRVFDSWQNVTPDALLSNLEKNQELKAVLLEETPWVREANNESERKRRIAILFDLNRMSNELDRAITKLEKMQKGGGAWPWFDGLPEDRYMTQHIICGIGHLDKMGVRSVKEDQRLVKMTNEGIRYLDKKIVDDYEELKRSEKKGYLKLSDNNTGYTQIHYLYTRSFFTQTMNAATKEAFDYYIGQVTKYWLNNSIYMKGMISLALHRNGDKKTPADIIKSLREFSLNSEEMGMYFKEGWGYYWWQAPIETQALMIEVFDEVAADQKAVDDLKVWLLKQKQTTDWKTTKSTAEACYALLLKGTNWLASDEMVDIQVGDKKIDPKKMPDMKVEAGTGYFKTSWTGSEIDQEMGKVKIHKKDEGVSWGSLYWQYFEQLDKITPAETPLKIKKELFVQENSATGPVLRPITEGSVVKVGDLVKVRIELRVDRNMEYVHMKDMRAAGFEPVNVLSGARYQDGLYYYEATRDAATNFFIHYLPKGTYVFEYPLRVFNKGDFSNGITTVQCMYAPEFTSHSEGIRVKVQE